MGEKDGHEQGVALCLLQSVTRIPTTRPQAQPIQTLHQSVELPLFHGRFLLTGQVGASSEGHDRTSCCILNVSTERFNRQIVCQSCCRRYQHNLTISLLISLDVDCSGSICCDAEWFPPTACRPRAGVNPVHAVEPEGPWGTVDMNYLEMIWCDPRGGRKLIARKSRECEMYAGGTASDSALA